VWPGGVDMIPVQYGQDPPPEYERRIVFVLDFSYPKNVMLEMKEHTRGLLVLDHHKSSAADCLGLDFCIFDDNESGASLAYKYLESKGMIFDLRLRMDRNEELTNEALVAGMKTLVDYVKDRDLWNHCEPQTHEINAALRSYPFDLETWDRFAIQLSMQPLVIYEQGAAILRYKKTLVAQQIRHPKTVSIGGHMVPIVECTTSDLISDVVGELAKGQPFAASWMTNADGIVVSLRSETTTGLDVSAIAKMFGGGGHRNSAGFRVNFCQVEHIDCHLLPQYL
jgi:nanoRNase/pAp phosphatase (c-di-AMP/oligoRNAs hydrolase)